jgi:hypothetical protein
MQMANVVVMMLDLSKAYDRASYLYLILILLHIIFFIQMVNLILGCLSLVSFVVLINGSTSSFLKPSRALKQGCPLASPLFFVIV